MVEQEQQKEMARIVFSGGAELTVAASADDVNRTLSRGRSEMAKFTTPRGDTIYVASGQVAYVEPVTEPGRGTARAS